MNIEEIKQTNFAECDKNTLVQFAEAMLSIIFDLERSEKVKIERIGELRSVLERYNIKEYAPDVWLKKASEKDNKSLQNQINQLLSESKWIEIEKDGLPKQSMTFQVTVKNRHRDECYVTEAYCRADTKKWKTTDGRVLNGVVAYKSRPEPFKPQEQEK